MIRIYEDAADVCIGFDRDGENWDHVGFNKPEYAQDGEGWYCAECQRMGHPAPRYVDQDHLYWHHTLIELAKWIIQQGEVEITYHGGLDEGMTMVRINGWPK